MGKQVDEARRLRERAMRGDVRPEDVRGLRPGPEQTYLRGAAFGTMDMKTIASLMPLVVEDRLFWASDYPHPDHPGHYLAELRAMVAPMSESGRRAILGENVARVYNLR